MRTTAVGTASLVLWVVLLVYVPLSEAAAFVFEDRCSSLENWELLDLGGDAQVNLEPAPTCPPQYGPNVIYLRGGALALFAKGVTLEKGTIVALYRENNPEKGDADGVIMVWADYPLDLAAAQNTNEKRFQLWFEQDNDKGLSFRYVNPRGDDTALEERAGIGLITDPWNRTNWIWQKVQIEGDRIRAKYWPAVEPEPEGWPIEATFPGMRGQRFGVRINSGDMDLAYFAADTEDIAVQVPESYLHVFSQRTTHGERIPATLFLNEQAQRTADVTVMLAQGGQTLEEATATKSLESGHTAVPITLAVSPEDEAGDGIRIALNQPLGAGSYEIVVGTGGETLSRQFEVVGIAQMQERFAELEDLIASIRADPKGVTLHPKAIHSIETIRRAASAHIDHARALIDADQPDQADRSLAFALSALCELKGAKGLPLPEDLKKRLAEIETPDTRVSGVRDAEPVQYVYRPEFTIAAAKPELESLSFVMGRSYSVLIPWLLAGTAPDRDFKFHTWLANSLGNRRIASSDAQPEQPTSQWVEARGYSQKVTLEVRAEQPPGLELPGEPVIEDGFYNLLTSVIDPSSGGKLLLWNAPGDQPGVPGDSYFVGEVYVSSAPLEIRQIAAGSHEPVPAECTTTGTFRNVGEDTLEFVALLTVTSETGRILHRYAEDVSLAAGVDCTIRSQWATITACDATVEWQALDGSRILTRARQDTGLRPPEGFAPSVVKANHVAQAKTRFITPVTVSLGPDVMTPFRVRVYAKGRLMGEGNSAGDTVTVAAEPWFGYYDVVVEGLDFTYEERVIATVVETRAADLLVNGEPFIVKGTNVHGMFGDSPAQTELAMRLMRDLGFNAWRGDYPAKWQVDLAYELGTVYTVLAPFSVTGTDTIFGRMDGPPLGAAREISRLMVERYRDSAGVLLWNSCNEIAGETPDLLYSLYPVYHVYDPMQRPVHYANLSAQDYWQGQDVMGVNFYYGVGERAVGRQPFIGRALETSRTHGLPLIFCEFNSWYGAVPTTGVEALRDMYVFGLERGMSGGFQYMDGDSDRHPGVYDSGFNTHYIYNKALIDAFADVEVTIAEATADELRLRVRNKRRFTLRQIQLAANVNGVTLPLQMPPDLEPEAESVIDIPLPDAIPGGQGLIEGELRFVTHFGFRCAVPLSVLLKDRAEGN